MPHTKSRTARLRTIKRLFSAKSTSLPIITVAPCSETRAHSPQPVARHQFPTGLPAYSREAFGRPLPRLGAALVAGRHVYPLAVLEVQYRRRRHRRARLFFPSVESRHHKHTRPHQARIAHLDAHLRSAYIGIEYGANVADGSCECLVGISI